MFGSIDGLVNTGSVAADSIYNAIFDAIEGVVGQGFGSLGGIVAPRG